MATWAELDNFDEMDDATAALIIQLQLQDSQEIFEASQNKGKNVAGKLMDSQAAFQLSMEEMERQATIISDHMMARSITQAVRADAQLLAASMTQERHELNDRRLACHLGGVAPPPLAIEASPIDSDDRLLDVMVSLSRNSTFS
jgi:UDP-N-acetylglucosamine transferase subunit ALG13